MKKLMIGMKEVIIKYLVIYFSIIVTIFIFITYIEITKGVEGDFSYKTTLQFFSLINIFYSFILLVLYYIYYIFILKISLKNISLSIIIFIPTIFYSFGQLLYKIDSLFIFILYYLISILGYGYYLKFIKKVK